MNIGTELKSIPFFGVRKMTRRLFAENDEQAREIGALKSELGVLKSELVSLTGRLNEYQGLSLSQIEAKKADLEREALNQTKALESKKMELEEEFQDRERLYEAKKAELDKDFSEKNAEIQRRQADAEEVLQDLNVKIEEMRSLMVTTEDRLLLQEAGVYSYRHPLTDAVAYQFELMNIEEQIKSMVRKDGGAVSATTNWTVNGSASQGRTMVRDFSKLLLRAFNAEADNLVRGMKPYKLDSAIEKIMKVSNIIERLGKTMDIRISDEYLRLRVREMELTADFLHKEAEQKEAERVERERLREERKAQQEIERERLKLEKEQQHYANALAALEAKGDVEAVERIKAQLADVQKAIEDVDYRAANIRAGYVYVISNLGSFGESVVKVGMTRRLDPMDRIRELSDASVPFNFDVHALFFSKDAVGIESSMHERLASVRVNVVNRRREFFRATPGEVKGHLADLAGELLQFQDHPEALEYRASSRQSEELTA